MNKKSDEDEDEEDDDNDNKKRDQSSSNVYDTFDWNFPLESMALTNKEKMDCLRPHRSGQAMTAKEK